MKKNKTTRRVLAVFCAVCIALLQCFVVMPAVTDGVHAGGSLDIVGQFDGKKQKDSYGGSIDGTVKNVLEEFDVTLSEIDSIWSDNDSLGNLSLDDKIVEEDGNYYIVVGTQESDDGGTEDILEKINKIEFQMVGDYSPIKKLYINSIGKVKANAEKTLKYGSDYGVKSGDDFFKDKYKDLIKATTEGASSESIDSDSISFTAGKAGTKVTVTIEDKTNGNHVSKSANVVSKTLTVSPTSMKLTIGRSGSITAKNDTGTISGSSLTWKISDKKVATVSNGYVTAKKKGSATITVKDKESGLSAKVKVTVTEAQTHSYSRPTYNTYHPTRSSNTIRTSGTGATQPTTATRPTETISTAAPSFQTMKVKEVYLTPLEQDPYGGDEFGDESSKDEDASDWDESEDYDDDGVTFPAAAGSAAVAVAVCGAGAVGRVRKFHIDMVDPSSVKDAAAGGDGSMGGDGQSAETTGDAGEGEGEGSEKRSRNPLKKFRK